MARQRLENRRPQITHSVMMDGEKYHVSIGYDLTEMRAKEVFIRGSKVGSHMDHLLDDIAVIISVSLQNGVSPNDLQKSLGSPLVQKIMELVNGEISAPSL